MPLFLLRYMSSKFEVVGVAIVEAKDSILARRKAEVKTAYGRGKIRDRRQHNLELWLRWPGGPGRRQPPASGRTALVRNRPAGRPCQSSFSTPPTICFDPLRAARRRRG
jgi:hypothetical protein